jgi:hypothetical protein
MLPVLAARTAPYGREKPRPKKCIWKVVVFKCSWLGPSLEKTPSLYDSGYAAGKRGAVTRCVWNDAKGEGYE